MWERGVFSQRAEIPAVFSFDHAPALSIPPQIHIKVSPLKETLAKVYFRTQRGFTPLLDERRRRRTISATDRRRLIWVDDMLAFTEHGQMILTWHRFKGIVFDRVVTKEDHSHQDLGKVHSHFLNTSRVQTSVDWFSRPERTRHAHVFCVLIRPPPVPSVHRPLLRSRSAWWRQTFGLWDVLRRHQNASMLLRSQEDSDVGMFWFYMWRTECDQSEAIFMAFILF